MLFIGRAPTELSWRYGLSLSHFRLGRGGRIRFPLHVGQHLYISAYAASLGSWLTSDFLKRRSRPPTRRQRRNLDPYNKRKYLAFLSGGVVLLTLLMVLSLYIGHEVRRSTAATQLRKELEGKNGKLIPASDPPSSVCAGSVHGNDILLVFGSHGNGAIAKKFPHVILRSESMGDILTLNKLSDESISVRMDIRDTDDKVIARLDDKGFTVNSNKVLGIERPDLSTLIVTDEYGTNTLQIRYANQQTITVRGAFHYPGRREPTALEMIGAANVCTMGADNGGADFMIR